MTNADLLFGSVAILVVLFVVVPLIGDRLTSYVTTYKEDMKKGLLVIGVAILICAAIAILVSTVAYWSGSLSENSSMVQTINSW